MDTNWHKITIWSSILFTSFSTVHLIDDFLAEVPLDFNLSVTFTEVLTFLYIISIVGLAVGAAKHSQVSYLGLAIAGLLISLAQFAKSIPEILQPGPWRAGLSSIIIVIGLTFSSIVMMVSALFSWRSFKNHKVKNINKAKS